MKWHFTIELTENILFFCCYFGFVLVFLWFFLNSNPGGSHGFAQFLLGHQFGKGDVTSR